MPRKKSPIPKRRGRPKKVPQTKADEIEVLASLGLFNKDIALFLGIRPETLGTNFRENLVKGRAGANVRLARLLWNHANKDPKTARYLAGLAHFLGWSEKVDIDLSVGGEGIDEKIVEPSRSLSRIRSSRSQRRRSVLTTLRRSRPFRLAAQVQSSRISLEHYARLVFGIRAARHHRVWIRALMNESLRRVCIICPPGHAKTTWISQLYSSWKIGQFPERFFGFISNTASQANRPSVAVRDTIEKNPRFRLIFPKVRPLKTKGWSENEWYVTRANVGEKDATFLASGVGGPILGARFDELIIDDANNQENTATHHQREKTNSWIDTTAMSRLKADGRAINIMTRWHEEDLGGHFIDQGWTVIHMPALGMAREDCLTCKNRDPKKVVHWTPGIGEALWPALWPKWRLIGPIPEQFNPMGDLIPERERAGPIGWAGMYQGNPSIPEGEILERGWWRQDETFPEMSSFEDLLQVWDTAEKPGADNDFSCCLTLGIMGRDAFVLDVWRDRVGFPALLKQADKKYMEFRPARILIEDKSSGTALLQALGTTRLAPLLVPVSPGGLKKEVRTNSITGIVEARRVHLPKWADWVQDFVEECAVFPNGTYDDQVDAITYGLIDTFLPSEREAEDLTLIQEEDVSISPLLDELDSAY